jgi:fatty acid desaturase
MLAFESSTYSCKRLMMSPSSKNTAAIAYTFTSYILGILSICSPSWQLNVLGVIAIVHSLVTATNLAHEFIHGNIFKDRAANAWWGQLMTHLNGACYAPWKNLSDFHLNHHLDRADVVRFDAVGYMQQIPPGLRSIYVALEWLYFPILEMDLRWRIILDPWLDRDKRSRSGRNLLLMLYRTLAFGVLAWVSLKAVLLYFIAYVCFVNVMRFMDAFQHTYEYVLVGQTLHKRDRAYEQANTFSNLVSVRYPWLNLLFLNFGYHNAHHHNMSCPWHELPELHSKLYGNSDLNVIPLSQLVFNYHSFRIDRLFNGQGEVNTAAEMDLNNFIGGVTVSFLTPP